MSDEEQSIGYGLIMPFVVVSSAGGLYDDESFVVGYELGWMDSALRLGDLPQDRYVHTQGLPQLDLIAMHYGYTMTIKSTDESGEWTLVQFEEAPNE